MNNKEKRFLIKAIAVLVLLVMLVVSATCLGTPEVEAWTYHAVAPGDTLWSIAKEYNPEYEGDVRHITYEIKRANGMDSSAVYVGELLEVPVMAL